MTAIMSKSVCVIGDSYKVLLCRYAYYPLQIYNCHHQWDWGRVPVHGVVFVPGTNLRPGVVVPYMNFAKQSDTACALLALQ